MSTDKKLSADQNKEFIKILEERFTKNKRRHPDLKNGSKSGQGWLTIPKNSGHFMKWKEPVANQISCGMKKTNMYSVIFQKKVRKAVGAFVMI